MFEDKLTDTREIHTTEAEANSDLDQEAARIFEHVVTRQGWVIANGQVEYAGLAEKG